jgi:hypothetical protein
MRRVLLAYIQNTPQQTTTSPIAAKSMRSESGWRQMETPRRRGNPGRSNQDALRATLGRPKGYSRDHHRASLLNRRSLPDECPGIGLLLV